MARKFSAFTNSPTRAATDTLVGLDVSAAAAAQNSYWTLNTLFSQISDNTADGSIRWGGVAAPAVSAAGKAALYFDSTSNTLKLSQNAGAYADVRSGTVTVPQGGTGLTTLTAYAILAGGTTATGNLQQVSGLGTAGQVLTSNGAAALPTWQTSSATIGGSIANTQVAVGSGVNTIAGSAAFTFAAGVAAISSSAATGGVVATGTAAGETGFTANQTVSGAASYAFHFLQTPSTAALLQLTTAGFTPANLVKANQLRLLGATGTVETLFDMADASTRFVFGVNNVEAASINATASLGLVLGVASSLTGRVRLHNSAGATYTQLSSGNAAASLNYILPATSPTAGQVLSAASPSGSDVTLSWATASSSALTATQVGFGSGSNLLSGEAGFTYGSTNGALDVTKDVNATTYISATNTNSGTASRVGFFLTSNVVSGALYGTSSGFTPTGGIVANATVLSLDAPNALIQGQTGQTLSTLLGSVTRLALTDAQYAITTAPTTGAGLSVAASTVTSGNLVSIAASGTAAASNTKTGLNVAVSGANATASQTTYGAIISNTSTGTTNTNIALQLTASGAATANTALNVTAGAIIQASNLATAFAVGPNGATTPAFKVDASAATLVNGLTVAGAASGVSVTLSTNAGGIFFSPSSGLVNFSSQFAFDLNVLRVTATNVINWSSLLNNVNSGFDDTGLARKAAGVLRLTDGGTGVGNLLLGTSSVGAIGTSGAGVIALANGTAPSTSPADTNQLFSADAATGDSQLFVRNEAGNIARLTGTLAYVTTQQNVVSSTALVAVSNLLLSVQASTRYKFELVLFLTVGTTGGFQVTMGGGSATATNTIFDTATYDEGTTLLGVARGTALTDGSAVAGATQYLVRITGSVLVNAGGTLGPAFAQLVSNGTNTSALVGSSFQIWQS